MVAVQFVRRYLYCRLNSGYHLRAAPLAPFVSYLLLLFYSYAPGASSRSAACFVAYYLTPALPSPLYRLVPSFLRSRFCCLYTTALQHCHLFNLPELLQLLPWTALALPPCDARPVQAYADGNWTLGWNAGGTFGGCSGAARCLRCAQRFALNRYEPPACRDSAALPAEPPPYRLLPLRLHIRLPGGL